MTAPELREVAAQLNILQELAHITIVECDVDITRMYPFAGSIPSISGRGGTDLRPVFSKECLGRAKPDGVIYFTDGDGPFPETHPGIKTLWVLTKPFDFKCPWGERAHLDLGRKPPPPKADPFGRAADKSTKP
jgi:predicted metal-dependent peptidase